MSAVLTRRLIVVALLLAVASMAIAGVFADLAVAWNKTVIFAMQMQRDLHRDLASAMRAVEQAKPAAYWSLVSLGFLYGLFHAIGPGHGKVVISTYLATHESRLLPGLALSFLSSLMQGVTAIVVVGLTALVLERSLRESQGTGIALEIVSYGLVMMIGAFLVWRSGRRLLQHSPAADHAEAHHEGCCHAHGPTATELAARLSVRDVALMVFSVGMRPCSGAILVLILAFATDLLPAGIAAVVAMSIGTGLG
ncbi:MAG: nickel/cobalt transporter, partial [Alphaproteobacteria bacterium]|nr:nickel/cobalt transporter [Alphaproteobacteria bacterium]